MKKFNRNQENNAMVQHSVDEMILQQNKKMSAENESYENTNSEIN